MSSSRRFIAGVFRLGLVALAIAIVVRHFSGGGSHRDRVRIQTEAPPPTDSLAPGDLRVYNADSSVDLVLVGNKILAGLSPKTVATVKQQLDTSASGDTSGFGASIAQVVKKSVAGAIGTHAVFPLADIRDIRYERGQIVFDWMDGQEHQLFGNTNVNGQKVSKTFRQEDAQRFIEAVKARKAQGAGSTE